jgi:hypothetical protein
MGMTLSSFDREAACVEHQKGEGIQKTATRANRHLDEAVIMNGILRDFLKSDFQVKDLDDLQKIIAESYVEIDDIDVTQQSYERAFAKCLLRYMKSEKRIVGNNRGVKVAVMEAENPIKLDISDFVKTDFEGADDISVRFLAIFDDGKTLEGIVAKKGLPQLGTTTRAKRNAENEIPLYLMLRALRELVPAGEKRKVVASYYYMKKPSDKSTDLIINDDYFNNAPIRELSEDYTNLVDNDGNPIPQPLSHLDQIFLEQLDKFATGYEKSEMDEEKDCKYCPKRAICYYKPVPTKSEEMVVKKREKLTPTDEQQAIINARGSDEEMKIFIVNAGAGSGKTETAIKERTVQICLGELEDMVRRYESGEDIPIPEEDDSDGEEYVSDAE